MKKNAIIIVLAIISACSIESAIVLNYANHKLHKKMVNVCRTNSDLCEEIKNLEYKCASYSEIVDSFDNPHHHDYLVSLQCFQALQK